jgi:hypothetical protein
LLLLLLLLLLLVRRIVSTGKRGHGRSPPLSGKSGTFVGFRITSLLDWLAWIVAHIDDDDDDDDDDGY